MKKNKIDYFSGTATLKDSNQISIQNSNEKDKTITSTHIIIVFPLVRLNNFSLWWISPKTPVLATTRELYDMSCCLMNDLAQCFFYPFGIKNQFFSNLKILVI